MSGPSAYLTLHPRRCDQCGACVKLCRPGAITVGPSYVHVDWAACTHCDACIAGCPAGAIEPAVIGVSTAGAASSAANVPKVVIGSRADAKVARKVAEQTAKAKGKSVTYGGKGARTFDYRKAGSSASVAVAAAAAPAGADVPGGKASAAAAVAGLKASAGAAASGAGKAAAAPAPKDATRELGPRGAVSWTLLDLALVLAMLLATVLAKDAALGIRAVGLMPLAGRTIVRAAVLAVYYSVQFGVLAWLAQRHGARLFEAFGMAGESRRDARTGFGSGAVSTVLVIVLFAGTELFSILYGLAMESLGVVQPVRLSSDLSAVFGSGGIGLALSIVLVALVGPLAEELAFRGVMMPVLGSRWGMWPAVLVTALVYAGYHFSLWLFLPTFVLGVGLGWLAATRRSLWPAVSLHVLYNAAAVIAGFMVTR